MEGTSVEPALRKLRIEDLKTKIAACQQECTELARRSATPDITIVETTTISHIREKAARHHDFLRYMLGLYELRG
jgi:hypothetical protein